jgi:hypothetical protein
MPGLTLVQIENQIRVASGLDTDQLPNTDSGTNMGVDTFLSREFDELIDKYDFDTIETTNNSVNTVVGVPSIALPGSFGSILKLSIQDPDLLTYAPLDVMSFDYFRQHYTTDPATVDTPLYYLHSANLIYLNPTPDQVYNIIYDIRTLVGFSSSFGTIINPPFHEIMMYGALARVFGEVVGDLKRAGYWLNLRNNKLSEASTPKEKEKAVDTPRAGLEFLGRQL